MNVVATATIALVGNPNCGKSTLFNAQTGARAKVMNAPGTTVDLQTGTWRIDGREFEVIDLPGTYSLLARSPDERVTTDYLNGAAGECRCTPERGPCRCAAVPASRPAGCKCGAPGTAPAPLQRDAHGHPDGAIQRDAHGHPDGAIQRDAHGHPDGAIQRDAHGHPDLAVVVLDATALARSLYLLAQVRDTGTPLVAAVTMLDVAATRGVEPDLVALADAAQVQVVALDPRTGTGLEALAAAIDRELGSPQPPRFDADDTAAGEQTVGIAQLPWDAQAERHFAWTERVLAQTVPSAPSVPVRSWSDRVDRLLLHPIWGIPVFAAVLWVLFELATVVATPLINGVSALVEGPLASGLRALIPGSGPVESLLVDGVLTGVGTVISFAPLLALIFLGIGLLEDSGYLARAAFVADRALRWIGLDGRAMVPLVVGFGCNVPAIAATKTMPDARRRLLTGLLIPFTSCPARLTVYVLVAGIFFPQRVGTVVFAMYMLSALLVVIGGLVLRATVFRDLATTRPLVLALPAYHIPRLRFLARTTGQRVWSFLKGAGGIIAATMVALWLLTAIATPSARGGAGPNVGFGEVPMSQSILGRAAGTISPVLAPAGLGDWRIASSLATGFVAKEAMVASLAQGFAGDAAVSEIDETRPPNWLADQLRATLHETSGGHASAAAAAFMVLVLSYTPCVATVAEQRRVFGARWALGAMAAQLLLAWVLAVGTFQLLRLVL